MSHSQDAVTPCDYRGLNAENAVSVKLRALQGLIGLLDGLSGLRCFYEGDCLGWVSSAWFMGLAFGFGLQIEGSRLRENLLNGLQALGGLVFWV